MAQIHLYSTSPTTLMWYVDSFANPINQTYYKEIVMSTIGGQGNKTTRPTGIVDTITVPYSGNKYETTPRAVSATAGSSITRYAYVNGVSGMWYDAGSDTITMPKARPSNFSWDSSKLSGRDFNITANEWNRLQTRINDFREYKGFTRLTTLTDVGVGWDYTYDHFNKIVRALNSMSPPSSPPAQVSYDGIIYASAVNQLRDSLNSIP